MSCCQEFNDWEPKVRSALLPARCCSIHHHCLPPKASGTIRPRFHDSAFVMIPRATIIPPLLICHGVEVTRLHRTPDSRLDLVRCTVLVGLEGGICCSFDRCSLLLPRHGSKGEDGPLLIKACMYRINFMRFPLTTLTMKKQGQCIIIKACSDNQLLDTPSLLSKGPHMNDVTHGMCP